MKIKALFALVLAAVVASATAQAPPIPEEMKAMDWMVGTWQGDLTMSFGGQDSKSKSTMVTEKALGGRFFRSNTSFTVEGMGDMTGQLMTTYNGDTKKWMSWWFDSMAPEMMEMTGTVVDGAHVSISKPTPMMGQDVVMRSTFKKVSNTKLSFKLEMQQGTDWVTMMQGDYTKK